MFVGRADELRLLDGLIDGTVDGSGSSLVVVGEPGAGVTSVLDAAARRAAPHLHAVRLRAHPASSPGAMLQDLAAVAGAPDDSADGVVRALLRAGASALRLLLVDDAQDADAQSLHRLAEVAVRVPCMSIIVGWRWSPEPLPPGLTTWERLSLGRLDPEASLAVARAAVGRDAAALPRLVERLGGNARALRSVPPLLAPDELAGRVPLPPVLPVPASMLAAWSALLPEPGSDQEQALLQVALCLPAPPAAGPRAVDPQLLERLSSSPVVRVDGDGWAHVGPWVRELVIARADERARGLAHRSLAASAARLRAAPSVVVHHLTASTRAVDDTVADALEVQARRADRLGLPDIGSTTWAAAALRTGDERARVRRAVAGARGITVTGPGMDAVTELLHVLDHAQLPDADLPVLDRLRTLERVALDPDSRIASLRSSVAQARCHEPEALPDMLWELTVLAGQHGEVDVGISAAEEYCALERSRASGAGPPWTGTALLSAALFQAGRVEEASRLRRRAHLAAAELDAARADLDTLFTAVALDDLLLDLSAEASERLLRLVQRLDGEAYPVACLYGIQGWRARARGDLITARRMLDLGLEIALPASALDVVCGLGALAAELSAIQGDGDLEREAPRLRALMESMGDQRRLSTLNRALGLRALVAGQLTDAVVHLSAAAEAPTLGRGLRDGVLMARVDIVEALVRVDDREAARVRAPAALSVLDLLDDDLAAALAWRVRSLVEEDDAAAVEQLGAALEIHAGTTDEFEHARSHLLRGERLRRMRRRGAARLDLREAETRFQAVGAAPWAHRAAAELRAAGGASRVAESAAWGLTPQELAVARAVARGGSNREIADELVLSSRTVEYHLGNVYRKLGLHGRAALAARILSEDAAGATTTPGDLAVVRRPAYP